MNPHTNIGQVQDVAIRRGVDARPPSFLVIDDDSVHRMVIGKVGEKAGYVLSTASSIDDAASKLRQQKFDCISLDLSLGGQSGAEILSVIAQTNSQALLIVISGATPEVRRETLRLARELFINVIEAPKPVDLLALRTRLNAHSQNV